MAANTLLITKAYRDGLAFTEAIVDGIRSDLQSWGQDVVDNFNQMRLDVFGSSYAYDNDGLANNTNPMNVQQTITPTAAITALSIAGASLTTGVGIDINTLDAMTTGFGLRVRSNSADTGTRALVDILNDNTAATGCTCLQIQNDANVRTLYLDKNGTGGGAVVAIDNDGTGSAVSATNTANTGDGVSLGMQGAAATSNGVYVNFTRAANSAYDFFQGDSGNAADVEVRLRGDGEVSGDAAAYVTPAADYAEMFECVDKAGIEPGYFVTFDEKEPSKIRKAATKDLYVLGVVSAKPAVVGDTDWNRWAHKYLHDEWNRYILDDKGDRVLNPKFKPQLNHITRRDRSEWVAVGLLGKLNVRYKDKTLDKHKGYVDVDTDGGGSINGTTGYKIIENIMPFNKEKGYGVVKILFRGAKE